MFSCFLHIWNMIDETTFSLSKSLYRNLRHKIMKSLPVNKIQSYTNIFIVKNASCNKNIYCYYPHLLG